MTDSHGVPSQSGVTPPPVPAVDSAAQNAFVQDWLTAYFKHPWAEDTSPSEWAAYEIVIEAVQETYSPYTGGPESGPFGDDHEVPR